MHDDGDRGIRLNLNDLNQAAGLLAECREFFRRVPIAGGEAAPHDEVLPLLDAVVLSGIELDDITRADQAAAHIVTAPGNVPDRK